MLNSTRNSGFGMGAITFTEMKNYFDLNQLSPSPQEVEVIKLFDSVAINQYNKEQSQQLENQKKR